MTRPFAEMKELALENECFARHIYIHYWGKSKKREKFAISGFDVKYLEISNKIGAYLQRYQIAAEYVKKKKASAADSSAEIRT